MLIFSHNLKRTIRNEAFVRYETNYLIHLLKRMQFDLHRVDSVPSTFATTVEGKRIDPVKNISLP